MAQVKRARYEGQLSGNMHRVTSVKGIMLLIARYLPSYADLRSYLEAFEGESSLDSMQVFLYLPGSIKGEQVWPHLQLRELSARNTQKQIQVQTVASFETLAALAAHVNEIHIDPSLDDPENLQKILSSHNVVVIHTPGQCRTIGPAWYSRLQQLPVVSFNSSSPIGNHPEVVQMFYTWPHLSTLTPFIGTSSNQDKIFEFIAQSRLHVLNLFGALSSAQNLTDKNTKDLTKWLQKCNSKKLVLDLDFTNTSEEVLLHFYKALWTCPSLRSLVIRCKLPFLDKYKWTNPMYLTKLKLYDNVLDDTTVAFFEKGLRDSAVTKLHIGATNLSPNGVQTITSAFHLTKIRKLILSGFNSCPTTFGTIADNLEGSKVKHLQLHCGKVSEVCMKLLVECFAKLKLGSLTMSVDIFEDAAAEILGDALPSLSISKLRLWTITITDVGGLDLAHAFARAPNLTTLCVSSHGITSLGVGAFVQALMQKNEPSRLFLHHEILDKEEHKKIHNKLMALGHKLVLDDRFGEDWFD